MHNENYPDPCTCCYYSIFPGNKYLKASTPVGGTTPANTLEAIEGIAKTPWADPNTLFELFNAAYPLAATDENPFRPTSTWGGGSGLTVICGIAGPVRPPRMGPVKKY